MKKVFFLLLTFALVMVCFSAVAITNEELEKDQELINRIETIVSQKPWSQAQIKQEFIAEYGSEEAINALEPFQHYQIVKDDVILTYLRMDWFYRYSVRYYNDTHTNFIFELEYNSVVDQSYCDTNQPTYTNWYGSLCTFIPVTASNGNRYHFYYDTISNQYTNMEYYDSTTVSQYYIQYDWDFYLPHDMCVLSASVDHSSYDYNDVVTLTAKITNSDGTTEGLETRYPDAWIHAKLIDESGQAVDGFIVQGMNGFTLECHFPLGNDDMQAGDYWIYVESNVDHLSVYTDSFYYTADKSHIPDPSTCNIDLSINTNIFDCDDEFIMTATVTDSDGNPARGVKVEFAVLDQNNDYTNFFSDDYDSLYNITREDGKCSMRFILGEDTSFKEGDYFAYVSVLGGNSSCTLPFRFVSDLCELTASVDHSSYDYNDIVTLTAKITNSDGTTEGLETRYPDAWIRATLVDENGQAVDGFIVQGLNGFSLECHFPLASDEMPAGNYMIHVTTNVDSLSVDTDVFSYTADKSHIPDPSTCNIDLSINTDTFDRNDEFIMTATVTDSDGNPARGVQVEFAVLDQNNAYTNFFSDDYGSLYNITREDGKCSLQTKLGENTGFKDGEYFAYVSVIGGNSSCTLPFRFGTVIPEPEDLIEAFVTRCYQVILGRNPDPNGLQNWCTTLAAGTSTASEIINGFVSSTEFQNKKLSNGECVEILYRAMLNRASDSAGKAGWTQELDKGNPLAVVINGFCGSTEFTKLCNDYGIKPGSVDIKPDEISRGKIKAFVDRCYKVILGRDSDPSGLETWVNALSSGKSTASEIIDGFVNSKEFLNKKLTNEQSVEVLYQAMLGRASDPAGLADWTQKLNAGNPFGVIINGFCGSTEFTNLCNDYGIKPGSVDVKPVDPVNPEADITKIQAFVQRCYSVILGRDADPEGLNNWTNALASGKSTASEIIDGFVNSTEFKNKNLSNEESVEVLYQAMLGRGSDPAGLADWTKKLNDGNPFAVVINGFCGSTEFTNICNEYGITPGSVKTKGDSLRGTSAAPEQENEETPAVQEDAAGELKAEAATEEKPEDKAPVFANEEKVREFIRYCYVTVLGRSASDDETEHYATQITNGDKAPKQVAQEIVFSTEFQSRGLGNEEIVRILYRLFLHRDVDENTLTELVDQLNAGMPLKALVNKLANSKEFKSFTNSMR